MAGQELPLVFLLNHLRCHSVAKLKYKEQKGYMTNEAGLCVIQGRTGYQ
jgi:hypothetical protein